MPVRILLGGTVLDEMRRTREFGRRPVKVKGAVATKRLVSDSVYPTMVVSRPIRSTAHFELGARTEDGGPAPVFFFLHPHVRRVIRPPTISTLFVAGQGPDRARLLDDRPDWGSSQ